MGDMMDYALWYGNLGMAVFPIKPRSKSPLTKHGFRNASKDPQQIKKWWSCWPDANIGVATGVVSGGLVVIDLDVDNEKGIDGRATLREWEATHGSLPSETWLAITGRGGYHYFYRDTSGTGCRRGLYEGVDIKGEGGYIVAPPSVHPNGRRYEWEQDPILYPLAEVDNIVSDFLHPVPNEPERRGFRSPEQIPEGERTDTLMKLVCSQQAKGLSDEAIKAAVRAENDLKCTPPLSDGELETEVFPALKRYEKGTAHYQAVFDKGKFRPVKKHSIEMVIMSKASEKSPDWLITDYMPRYQITSLAGDGGSGKTTVWCAIAAAVSSGRKSFLESFLPEDWGNGEPKKVMFFSAEDSFEYTLKRRLRKNGANLDNICSIDIADERFQDIKFNSPFLEQLLDAHRPALCIFDPIQAFVPPDIRMGDRNAMRGCLSPLIGYGEKYGTTFLIIEHANKQSGVWGRKRIADSADIWDISRSVIMAGETSEEGIRYLSHEKSNYGQTGGTVLYTIINEVVEFKGYTTKKDKDFVTETDFVSRQKPQREEAKEFILEFLKDGEKEVSELDDMAKAMSISANSIKNAKAELKKDGKIKYRPVSLGKGQGFKYYISLIATAKVN